MRDHLLGQVVEQVGMLVVGHVVEIHQPADDVVFQTLLIDAALAQADHIDLLGAQVLDPELVVGRRIVDRRQIQREWLEP